MVPRKRSFSRMILGIAIFAATAAFLSPLEVPLPKEKPGKGEKARRTAIVKFFPNAYWIWLNEEVTYIITDEERGAFKKLTTDDEREQFIELFWERRNPTPGSPENRFKKEYYRRIVFANQHFSCGILGWKTDRGRIYILYGPPDEIESHQQRVTSDRPSEGVAPQPSTYSTEEWRYHSILGLGRDIVLKFSDQTNTGDFHRVLGPDGEDPLKGGLPKVFADVIQDQVDRVTKSLGKDDSTRIDAHVRAFNLPGVEFHDLRAVVTSKLAPPRAMPVSFRMYAVPATEETTYTLLAMQFPSRRLKFLQRGEVMHAGLRIYGRLITLGGRIVRESEKGLEVDVPEDEFPDFVNRKIVYQEVIPLRPARYKLSLVLKDALSGQMGLMEQEVRVPRFDTEMLTNSPLILADTIELPQATGYAPECFLIGGNTVLPNVDQVFSDKQELGVYTEIYGLGIDQSTHRSSFGVEFRVLKDGNLVLNEVEDPASLRKASMLFVATRRIALKSLPSGQYTLQVRVTDHIRNQTISPSTTFDVM